MKINRRVFLRRGLSALALAGAAPGILMAEAKNHKLDNIGIIGGVPKDMKRDWQKSLKFMADTGYTVLESDIRGPSAEDFLAFLRGVGLRLVSCGAQFKKDLAPEWLNVAKSLNSQYAIAYTPFVYPLDSITLPQLKENAKLLDQAGKQAKASGVRLAIHNHHQEFKLLDGKPIFDHILDLTNPDLVKVELDLCWVTRGGRDAVDYLKRYPGRIDLLHIKDLGKAPEYAMVPVGGGTIDFARIFAAARKAGVKHYIVELEDKANTTEAAVQSFKYLSALRF